MGRGSTGRFSRIYSKPTLAVPSSGSGVRASGKPNPMMKLFASPQYFENAWIGAIRKKMFFPTDLFYLTLCLSRGANLFPMSSSAS